MAKNNASLKSVDEFLKRCQQSGYAAYFALRSVLEHLEDPKTRTQARIFLSDLHKRFPTPPPELHSRNDPILLPTKPRQWRFAHGYVVVSRMELSGVLGIDGV